MLRGAVQRHDQENQNTQPKSLSQQLFPSSSPPVPAVQKSITAFTGARPQNALRQTPQSTLNQQRGIQSRTGASGGIKRTASGLAKTIDGSFEDVGKAQTFISSTKGMTAGSTQAMALELFDEDDFDSDIDLEFEEPKSKPTASYPKLPPAPSRANVPKPVVYPTLPRQQAVQSNYEEDSGYGSAQMRSIQPTPNTQQHQPQTETAPPGSSAPLPWSSSPAEHMTAHDPTSIRRFAYNGPGGSHIKYSAPAPAPPVKRRTLPWLKDGAKEDDGPIVSTYKTNSRTVSKPEATPAPKKSAYPWNTTASVIKDQQKKHRDEVKRIVKKSAGSEESIAKAKTKSHKVARVFLSEEQQHVLDLVVEQKKSCFFTGSAGTGKSVLMREIISSLRRRYVREPDRVAVTASTGLAACNVGGVTLHSFAGIGLGKESVPELVKKIKKNQKARHRWMRTKILVVDEVSMVDGELFDKLEAIARQLRNNGRPFGGIQLVITGDFFQLPPVPDSGKVAKFAFDATTWSTTVEYTIGLHHVFRQKDPVFAGMLNEMREGRLTDSSIKAFRSLSRDLTWEDTLSATELFPLRTEVERANADRLSRLQGELFTFEAKDGGAIVDKAQRDKLLGNCLAPETISLKKGAQVMLIKNIDETLVNGSIGRVVGFMDEQTFERYSTNEDEFEQDENGVLLSQGATGSSPTKEERAKKRMQENLSTSRRFPMVRFTVADGTFRDLLCQHENWKIELPNGEVQASRTQVPLILAWALSIHKAQGQTLERVKVDLGKVFEKGQAYVALSRATSMAGLQVLRFDPKKVNAHERVRTFYSNLARVELDNQGKGKEKPVKRPGLAAEDYESMFVDGEL